jgi:hypothetical protein
VWNRGIGDGLPPRPQGTVGDTGTTADTGTVPDTDTVPGTTTDTGTPLGTNDTDDALAIGEGEEKAEDAAACGCQSTAWPSLGTWARRR